MTGELVWLKLSMIFLHIKSELTICCIQQSHTSSLTLESGLGCLAIVLKWRSSFR